MVAGCPKCSARYRVDVDRIGPDGAKLRCTKCSAVFLVRAPRAAAPEAPAEAPSPSEERAPLERSTPAPAAESSADAPPVDVDRTRLVLIADPDEARGKRSAEAVASWGLIPHLVHDGVEAMLAIQRMLPSAVVLDAALPKMFGFQVCEVVKRNESLRETTVVLVGAIHHQDRYRRNPAELYGADVYIEQPDLPEGLREILREGGLPIDGENAPAPASPPAQERPVADPGPPAVDAAVAPETRVVPDGPPVTESSAAPEDQTEPSISFEPPAAAKPSVEPPPAPPMPELSLEEPVAEEEKLVFETDAGIGATPTPAPAAAEAAPSDDDVEKNEERERAERLARIAVSEMLLYQPEKFEQASRDGNLEQVLDLEIQEARALLRQRISEEVRAEKDFIMDELNRVAAERSQAG